MHRLYATQERWSPIASSWRPAKLDGLEWLPSTCAYRLRADGQPLHDWHYLVSGSRETVHEAGQSTRGWTVSEVDAGDLEWHLVDRPL